MQPPIASSSSQPIPQTIPQPNLWSPLNPHYMPQQNMPPQNCLMPENRFVAQTPVAMQTSAYSVAPASQPLDAMSGGTVSDCYTSLLGIAETFRTSSPPNIRLAVHCLKAVLHLKIPANLEARTHLQLGRLLFYYSKSDDQTKFHLEKARTLGAHLRANDDSIKFEAAALLAEFFEKKGKRYEATCILNDAIRLSNNNPYWHCRLLLELAKAHVAERDVNSACEILAMGSEFAHMHNSDYTRGLFLLGKCLLHLANRQLPEVNGTLNAASQLIENCHSTAYRRESLRVFYLVLYVSYFLLSGQAKSARPILRQLHQSIQQLAAMDEASETCGSTNELDRFQWMPREHMVILVYLISVMHAMQTGMLERAKRSAEKALTQIEKLSVLDTSPLLTVFHVSLLEHTAMGRLVMGVQTAAIQDIVQACRICQANPSLMQKRLPQLHTLIGLYAMSMNCMSHAEDQFKLALRLIVSPNPNQLMLGPGTGRASCQPDGPRDTLSVLICLNLALVHIRRGNTADCEALLNEVFTSGAHIVDACYCLRAAAAYVRAFQAFYENRLNDAKAFLRETVRLGNEEELHRLSASAFITMGQIYLNEQNTGEGYKMITAAIHVANKLPDIGIQLWATALLKGVASLQGDTREETFWFDEHDRHSKFVISEHVRAINSSEHRLIEWKEGPLPDLGGGGSATSSSVAASTSNTQLL